MLPSSRTRAHANARLELRARSLSRLAESPMAAASSTRRDAIRLQLLGEPKLIAGGSHQPLERKDAALLAMLAVDGPTPRIKVAALLWPDGDGNAARNNLRQRLHRLRRRAGRDVVESRNDVLQLAADIAHDLAAVPKRLTEDADAAGGELLGDLTYSDCPDFSEWIGIAREGWRNARRSALAEAASRLESEGLLAPALHYAERLVADDPLLEHAHRRLMRLHYLRGDRAAALEAYRRCCDVLERHLGARPARETLDLGRLIEASDVLPPAPAPSAAAKLPSPRLVGRDSEWQRLEDARTQRRIAVVAGEPGIGKTRLLSDFTATQAAGGIAVVLVAGRPGDERVPYATLARLLHALQQRLPVQQTASTAAELGRLLPELGPAPKRPLEPARLHFVLARALLRWQRAGLSAVAVDDLHLADAASLDALLTLAEGEAGRALGWTFSIRSGAEPARFAQWREGENASRAVELRLGPLDLAAIARLLDSVALPGIAAEAWAAPLARHTGGNPLFVLETLSAIAAQGMMPAKEDDVLRLPASRSAASLIERRLGLLSPPALRLARVAAIAGGAFSVELAAYVLQSHPLDLAQAWRELEAARIIRGSAFASDLILEVARRSLPAPIEQALCRQVSAFLAGTRPSDAGAR
jgi:DNA-binding SARP family transcriptional activator